MKTLTALVLAAGLAFSAGTAANAMSNDEVISMGKSMLVGALHNALQTRGYDTDLIEKLTLTEIVTLSNVLTGDDDSGRADGQVKLIFDRASTR